MLPIKVPPVADTHIQKAAAWWLANREKAPQAFKEELERGFALISQRPDLGAKATNVKLKDVRMGRVSGGTAREEFVRTYSEPVLQNFLNEQRAAYPYIELPDVPQIGNLDIRQVLESPYFFA